MKYQIVGRYQGGAMEYIDSFATKNEAYKMLTEYRMAFGSGWSLEVKVWRRGQI